jgi:hypothetical protein
MPKVHVNVLESVRIADGDPIYGRMIIKGTQDAVPEAIFGDLVLGGYVEEAGTKRKAQEALREDGPTIAEYVAAGYLASQYPPVGYASKSTPEEIAAAIEVGKGGKAGDAEAWQAMRDDLMKQTVAQLHDIAKAEEIDLAAGDNKGGIVDKIVAARSAKASQ